MTSIVSRRRARFSYAASVIALCLGGFAQGAWAQTASPGETQSNIPQSSLQPDSARDAETGEIVVTGSRIRRHDFDSPSPVVSIDANTLQQSGTTNLTDFLTGYPALVGSSTSRDNSGDRAGIGATGLNLLDLRNLGTDRTLVLVDGRRHVSGLPGSQSVDINTIPTDLVERIDVLTGGASAVYGADGVSGVVNFILKKNFEGLTARAQAGISEHGDAGQRFITATFGKNFADGRGNVAVAYEYGKDDRYETRDRDYLTGTNRYAFYRNPNYIADTAGSYLYTPQNDIRYDATTRNGGVDVDGDGYPDFNGDGSVYDPGQSIPGGYARGGSATPVADYGNDLLPSVQRHVVNAIGHFDVSDKLTIFAEGKYANIRSYSLGQPTFDYYLFIPEDNPYIPATIRAAIDPGLGGVLVTRDNFDLGQRGENVKRETFRSVIGAKGDLSDSLHYELSYVYGRTNVTNHYVNDIYDDRFFAAIDAVQAPGNGPITCRANIQPGWTPDQPYVQFAPSRDVTPPTTFSPGQCSPINLFGEGVSSQAGLDFIHVNTVDRSSIQQHVISGAIDGDFRHLFSLPGGELGYVLGAEYRKEKSTFTPDPIAARGLTFTNSLSPTVGEFDVKEAFAELAAPLLKDRPFAQSLEFGAAFRVSNYSTVGTNTTWKIDGSWAPIRDIRFRGTYSKAVRAPNIGELFSGGSQTFQFFDDPCNPTNINGGKSTRPANCAAVLAAAGLTPAQIGVYDDTRTVNVSGISGGNPNLLQEKAKTWTAGVILQPRFLPGFTMSADWYNINLENAINTVTAQELAELCVDQADINNQFCSSISRQAGTGLINGFTVNPKNVANFKTAGLDINANYNLRTAKIGTFNLKLVGSYLDELKFVGTPGAAPTDKRGRAFAPKYQANAQLTWNTGAFTFNYGLSWFDGGRRFSLESLAGNANYVAPEYVFYKDRWVHDFYASVDAGENFQFYGGVNNAFNQKPSVGSIDYPVDTVGRYFFVGARVKMPKF